MANRFSSRFASRFENRFDDRLSDSLVRKQRTTYDLSDLEQLKRFSAKSGVDTKEIEERYGEKPSLFGRTMDILSRGTYVSAGAAKALLKNIQVEKGERPKREKENILLETWKGLSGKEKETYSDVLMEAGVENRLVKGGVGFALDVALDPTTYIGGSVMKGIGIKTPQIYYHGIIKNVNKDIFKKKHILLNLKMVILV